MAVQSLTSAALIAALEGGLIRQDIMEQISDITDFPLVFTDLIGTGSHKNEYSEWTKDQLASPDTANAVIDGQVTAGDDSSLGEREGNHSQTSVKKVKVSHRANHSDTIGRAKEVIYQIQRRTKELKRDLEAIMLNRQPSRSDDGDTVAGLAASFQSWLVTNTFRGATGADGGFATTSPTIVDAPGAGTKVALAESTVRDALQAAYISGGDPSIFLTTPGLIRKWSEYLFTSTARVAVQQTQTGKAPVPSTAIGTVNVYVTDFGSTLSSTPNRLMPNYTDGDVTDAIFLDPAGVKISFLQGVQSEQLGKTGTFEEWLMSTDWTLQVMNEAQHAIIADVDESLPVLVAPA